ncbi:unnamed protein product [Caenorhabditis auriculariae]|uniref:Uncharacterized protein n=1 Tax=Caenorhabditis auriculariae TaxID=2777116 RepID=A0A8S1GUD7_9PELO|nr:unnamed protein product [Caenorhabditis auriculariae]
MSVSFDFTGKRVLVTGASQGIGRAISLQLAKDGATVFAMARNEEALDELVEQSRNEKGTTITKVVGDVTASEEELAKILEPHQPFDGLVNNAGVAHLQTVGCITEEAVANTFNVNLRSALFIAQLVSREMIKHKKQGSIVNISSQAAIRPFFNHTAYCASKASLDMVTRCLAAELGHSGIRVNSVNPTVVMTEMGKANWSDPHKASQLLDRMPIKRFAEPEDVVSATLFLLSNASAMTTGAAFPVDGGYINN